MVANSKLVLMDKSTIIKVFAAGLVLIFVLQMFASNVLSGGTIIPQGGATTGPSKIAGNTEFDAIVKYYEPYIISENLSEQMILELKSMDGVEEVTASGQGFIISLKTSKNMPNVYQMLLSKNISTSAVAVVILPNEVVVKKADGTNSTVLTGGAAIKVGTEPFSNEGGILRLKMSVEAENGYLARYSQPMIAPISATFVAKATVQEKLFDYYSYVVPWEKRNEIDVNALSEKYGAENVSYSKKDSVILSTPLSTSEMLTKKYDYISFITEYDITPNENFTDKERILSDFGNATFQDSVLEVLTSEPLDLKFENKKSGVYSLVLSSENYTFKDPYFKLALDEPYQNGAELEFKLDTLVVGKSVVSILDSVQIK